MRDLRRRDRQARALLLFHVPQPCPQGHEGLRLRRDATGVGALLHGVREGAVGMTDADRNATPEETSAAIALDIALARMTLLGASHFELTAPTPRLAETAERLMLDAFASAEQRNGWKNASCKVTRRGTYLRVELTRPS